MGKPLLGLEPRTALATIRMVPQEPRVMVFEKQITIIKIILSTNFDDLIIEISDIIILIIQISFRKTDLWFYYFRKLSFLYFRLFF